jgi:hypothetical protein
MASIALAIAAISTGAPASAQTSDSLSYRHRLLGVFDTQSGEPLEGVEITNIFDQVTALTTKTGTVTLAFLPEGAALIRVRKVGYQPTTITVVISPVDTVPITVTLARSGVTLEKVVTIDSNFNGSRRFKEFEERRAHHVGGYFITAEELRKNEHSTMTNVLRRVSGMNIVCNRSGSDCRAASARAYVGMSGTPCFSKIYVDGIISTETNLQLLQVTEYGGVEYYSGAEIPPQYNATGSACAVLLLWTRDR